MGNLMNITKLIVARIDKNGINEKSLQEIFEHDSDFRENNEVFRPDTLKKGFENEAHRVSAEIFKKHQKVEEEDVRIERMMKAVFKVNNFIGDSTYYGNYQYAITETEFEYVISIAYSC